MTEAPFSGSAFRTTARTIAATGRRIYDNGWSPATSSNYSMRLNREYCAITVSGRDKALLDESDVMAVDMHGRAATQGRPSAETGLHTQLYQRLPDIGAVLHTHSHASTVLTMHCVRDTVILEGYELLKALSGIDTHDTRLEIPVLENSQDIPALARAVDQSFDNNRISHAYLIRGHGLYTWAGDMATCYRHLEALETLLAVTLERYRINTGELP